LGANIFTPGLKVTRMTALERERRLPLKGSVTVAKGDMVTADDVVARTELPGNVHMVNVAGVLNVHQNDVPMAMLKSEGDVVEKGEAIALSKSLFGLFKSTCKAPVTGTLESVSSVTGQAVLREPPIPVEVLAYIDGEVTEVLPDEGVIVSCHASFIQGIFGIGGEVSGEIRIAVENPGDLLGADALDASHAGCVVIVGRIASAALLTRAAELGVRAIVAGGIDAKELKDFLGYDLGVAITGSEEKGVTLVTTEGFGELAMAEKTFDLLKANEGRRASANGATQIRAGVMRPEIVIPQLEAKVDIVTHEQQGITIGSPIRVIRAPYFGVLAEVVELPPALEKMESETMVRVLRAKLPDGETVTVPRANVEMIQEV
jgi:hypothetical protein